MAFEPKGAYNRAFVLNGEKFGYWKGCRNVRNVIQNGPFEITMTNVDGVIVPKPEAQWNMDDEKKWLCDWKARNIIIFSLGVDEYYCVFHCSTSKSMWDALQVAHDITNEVKQARINTLNQEFELFHMKHGKTIANIEKRFTHLANRLNALGKTVSNELATNKILRFLNREW